MPWNWELEHWPHFEYEAEKLVSLERDFLIGVGSASAYLKTMEKGEFYHFIVEMLSIEGLKSSQIEGEILNRESLQSSIKKHLGLSNVKKPLPDKENGMAQALCHVYETFNQPLTHAMMEQWHAMLFQGSKNLSDLGSYRTHSEPMQIVSSRYGDTHVFFEAPPSNRVLAEMTQFVQWFNDSKSSLSILARASIAHVYFESIHPFEDGNGRIGRLLVEKILSQGVGCPVVIALSKNLEKRKKEYYAELEKCNRTLKADDWVVFFSTAILEAHQNTMELLTFILQKSKMLHAFKERLNERQTKVLLRLFEEGPSGFKGGLTAEKYIKMTKTTRATATRDLTDLVEKGVLVKTGELRHTRYHLNLKEEIR